MLKYKVGDEVYYVGVIEDGFGEQVTVLEVAPYDRAHPYKVSLEGYSYISVRERSLVRTKAEVLLAYLDNNLNSK